MKNFYIQTIVLLFVVLAGFTSKSNAQFSNGDEVYFYQYEKTVGADGVVGKDPDITGKIKCIYFHDGRLVELYFNAEEKDILSASLAEDPSVLLNLLKQRYYCYVNLKVSEYKPLNPNSRWNYRLVPRAYKYFQPYSTSAKYTYKATSNSSSGEEWSTIDYYSYYSFSLDKSELIEWNESNERSYWKRIAPNSLKPNLDFLD